MNETEIWFNFDFLKRQSLARFLSRKDTSEWRPLSLDATGVTRAGPAPAFIRFSMVRAFIKQTIRRPDHTDGRPRGMRSALPGIRGISRAWRPFNRANFPAVSPSSPEQDWPEAAFHSCA